MSFPPETIIPRPLYGSLVNVTLNFTFSLSFLFSVTQRGSSSPPIKDTGISDSERSPVERLCWPPVERIPRREDGCVFRKTLDCSRGILLLTIAA